MRFLAGCCTVVPLAACLLLAGCTACSLKQNPDELREKTADATAALKSDAKAVAQGVREGMSRDHRVDLNRATSKQLEALPGVTTETARKIIANRPYASPDDLTRKHIISEQEYRRIADKVSAGK